MAFWFNAGYPGAEWFIIRRFYYAILSKQPDGSVAPDALPPIDFHVKYSYGKIGNLCDSGLIGNCTIGLGILQVAYQIGRCLMELIPRQF